MNREEYSNFVHKYFSFRTLLAEIGLVILFIFLIADFSIVVRYRIFQQNVSDMQSVTAKIDDLMGYEDYYFVANYSADDKHFIVKDTVDKFPENLTIYFDPKDDKDYCYFFDYMKPNWFTYGRIVLWHILALMQFRVIAYRDIIEEGVIEQYDENMNEDSTK